jgi:hypothetical protein
VGPFDPTDDDVGGIVPESRVRAVLVAGLLVAAAVLAVVGGSLPLLAEYLTTGPTDPIDEPMTTWTAWSQVTGNDHLAQPFGYLLVALAIAAAAAGIVQVKAAARDPAALRAVSAWVAGALSGGCLAVLGFYLSDLALTSTYVVFRPGPGAVLVGAAFAASLAAGLVIALGREEARDHPVDRPGPRMVAALVAVVAVVLVAVGGLLPLFELVVEDGDGTVVRSMSTWSVTTTSAARGVVTYGPLLEGAVTAALAAFVLGTACVLAGTARRGGGAVSIMNCLAAGLLAGTALHVVVRVVDLLVTVDRVTGGPGFVLNAAGLIAAIAVVVLLARARRTTDVTHPVAASHRF